MIGPGAGARVMVATRPVDFRKGPDALAALVGKEYGGDPFSGVIYVFRAKRSDRIKLIWWDGTGLCLMAKKLEQGGFRWPGIQDGVMRLTAAQLGALLEGLDWRCVHGGRAPTDRAADRRLTGVCGHCNVRRWVMGEAAIEREASADEIEAMCAVVAEAMRSGAAGFSTSLSPTQSDIHGRPVPSRFAGREEVVALAEAAGIAGSGSICFLPPELPAA